MTESLTGQMVGNVRLETFLGEGAVGVVYRGHHTMLGIDVAVKILKIERHQVQASYYYERFRREAQITAKLDHPNLVKVRDFGQYNSIPYIVMDLVDGFSLQEYLRRRKQPLDEQTILKILLVVADALSVAHTAGVIHRDLKPANLLISKRGQLKVVDLGLAREEGMPTITMEKVTVGSPAYMAPESLTPEGKIDHRSDIYALGVIGYEMVFGHLPYRGDITQIIHGHIGGQARFDLPTSCRTETVTLIQKMMAHDCTERYQNAKDVVRAARHLLTARRKTVGSADIAVPIATVLEERSDPIVTSDILPTRDQRMSEMAAELVGSRAQRTPFRWGRVIWRAVIGFIVVMLMGYIWLTMF
jgi:serine/threonine protein kinase